MKAIAAMDLNRVIGNKGKIPWHISEDFKWFKKCTVGHNLVMGRTTFENVGFLPGRYTYILSNSFYTPVSIASMAGINFLEFGEYTSIGRLLEEDNRDSKIMWVCGGAKTYEVLLPYCDELYMTHVIDEYEGDTFMPEFESQFPNSEILREEKNFWIVKHWK